MRRENQDHHLAVLNRPCDFARKGTSRPYIPRRHPALDSALLQRAADRLRYLLVLRRVRNENSARHKRDRIVSVLLTAAQTGNGINNSLQLRVGIRFDKNEALKNARQGAH